MKAKSFAVELKNFRKAQKLTQKELAEKFGVSALTIYNWEGGHSNPKKSILPNIQKIMAEMSGTPAAPSTPAPVAPKAKKVSKKKAVKVAKKQIKKSVKAPKAPKAPKVEKVAKIAKKRAPWGSKSYGFKTNQEDIENIKIAIVALEKKLEAHISSVSAPAIPTGSAPAVKASDQKTVGSPDTDSLLREMCLALRRSRVNAEVRGNTRHVVEWPDVCNVYKRSLEVLGMEDK